MVLIGDSTVKDKYISELKAFKESLTGPAFHYIGEWGFATQRIPSPVCRAA